MVFVRLERVQLIHSLVCKASLVDQHQFVPRLTSIGKQVLERIEETNAGKLLPQLL